MRLLITALVAAFAFTASMIVPPSINPLGVTEAHAKKAKKAKSKKPGPGRCGTFNYWNKKQKKCVSKVG
mgnify:FL=1